MTKGWQIALAVVLVGMVIVATAWAWPTMTALDWETLGGLLPFGGEAIDFLP
jgi:hypothetical protein